MTNNPKYIIIHCTDTSYTKSFDQLDAVNQYHKEREFSKSSLGYYVGYHNLITGDTNHVCRLETDEGSHCNQVVNGLSINFQSLGICIGFDGDIEMPTDIQYKLLQEKIWAWQDKYNIPNEMVKFHRDFKPEKTCPGSLITNEWLKKLLSRPSSIPTEKCIDEREFNALKSKIGLYEALITSIMDIINKFKK